MNGLTSWQKVLLVISSMALAVVCTSSKTCGEHAAQVLNLAYVIVGGIIGLTQSDKPQLPKP
jgi:NAD/NADP transhydrogenase beta subunit